MSWKKQLGVQIFERDNKKVLVTPMGARLLAKAHEIKMDVDDLYLLAQSEKEPLSYPMTLGVIPTIGPYLLPKVLPAVRREYPDFSIADRRGAIPPAGGIGENRGDRYRRTGATLQGGRLVDL